MNLQPAPSHRAALIPIAPRPQVDLGLLMSDLFQSDIPNHKSQINLAGAFRFELKTSVLETSILPIKLRTFKNLE